MRTFYDDHSGDDEVPVNEEVPTDPGYGAGVNPDPADTVAPGGMYHDPTQPVEPVYPHYDESTRVVHTEPPAESGNVDKDESLLDKLKRFVTEESEKLKKDS